MTTQRRWLPVGSLLLAGSFTVQATAQVCATGWQDAFDDGAMDCRFTNAGPCGDAAEVDGVLRVDTPPGCEGYTLVGLDRSRYGLCGDFDFAVDFVLEQFATPAGCGQWRFASVGVARASDGQQAAVIERFARPTGCGCDPPSEQTYKAWVATGNDCDPGVRWAPTTDVEGSLRIAREGATIRLYYWSDGWVLLKEEPNVTDETLELNFYSGNSGDTSGVRVAFDDLRVVADGCPTDIDTSGATDFEDLLALLTSWGACGCCAVDFNRDGQADFEDLLGLLAAWGPCP